MLELLPNHLCQHPLHHSEHALVLEQLVRDAVLGVLGVDDDVHERGSDAHCELPTSTILCHPTVS